MSRHRQFLVGLLVGSVGFLFVASSITSANATSEPDSIGVRLAEVPSDLADDPRASLYIVDHVAPGTRLERDLEVSSSSAAPVQVELYAAGASIENGVFAGDAGRTANELSGWVSVAPKLLEVPADGTATTTVVIDVPADAVEGEQYAAVWVQLTTSADSSAGVAMINRVGIRIYLSVGGGGSPPTDFEIGEITAERSSEGVPFITASIRNTGGRALDLRGTLTLSNGPGGLTAGPFPARVTVTVAVGETGRTTIELDPRLPAGPWNADLTLASGLVEKTVSGVVTFPAAGASSPVLLEATVSWWVIVVLGILVVVLAVGVGVLAWIALRRRSVRRYSQGSSVDPSSG